LVKELKPDESRKVLATLFGSSKNKRMLAEGYQLLAFIEMNTEGDGYYDAAYDALDMSLSYDQTIPQVWVTLGLLDLKTLLLSETEEEMLSSIDDMKQYAQKALAINKDQASAYYLLSQVAVVEQNRIEEDNYRKLAIEAVPRDITLGDTEKKALLSALNAKIITEVKK
jgi:hypothetical protein